MARLILQMIVKNEAHRYLRSMLDYHVPLFDEVHVCDDQSDDGTLDILHEFPIRVTVRGRDEPSFGEHEARFRSAAWDKMKLEVEPEPGDYIVCLDADEFIWTRDGAPLRDAILKEDDGEWQALFISIEEFWSISPPQVRLDGLWNIIAGYRVYRYDPDGKFKDVKLGGGSSPIVQQVKSVRNIAVAHFGYADLEDRKAKYARYSAEAGAHNIRHINSIMSRPELELVDVPFKVQRG